MMSFFSLQTSVAVLSMVVAPILASASAPKRLSTVETALPGSLKSEGNASVSYNAYLVFVRVIYCCFRPCIVHAEECYLNAKRQAGGTVR